MNKSIRFRLWLAATVSVLVALAIAGVGLRYLFERHVERREEAVLAGELDRLIAGTTLTPDGNWQVAPVLTDPRFDTPISGYYWQVEDLQQHRLTRSRSLWDAELRLPDNVPHEAIEVTGPEDTLLIAVARTITDASGRTFRAVVAEDHRAIRRSLRDYGRELALALIVLGVILAIAIFVQISIGLAPLESIRLAVRDVVAGGTSRLEVPAPTEVRPLAEEINRLLDMQQRSLARARSRATDLAHGLKTPLQVLSADIRALRAKGERELADEIEKSAGTIKRHIERELARSRLAPGVLRESRANVADTIERVVSVVKRTPEGERLTFGLSIDKELTAPIDEGDLAEIAGNLIENAARFARSSVRVSAVNEAAGTRVVISDDGPGIADSDRDSALTRGVRFDTRGGGLGLGLAIVSDVVEAYGGEMTMANGGPGLEVRIFLPNRD